MLKKTAATTTSGIAVKPFHPRLFKTAIEARQPVVPLMISYHQNHHRSTDIAWDDENHFLATAWRVLSRKRTDVIVQQFEPVWPELSMSRTELAKTCHSQISRELTTLYPD